MNLLIFPQPYRRIRKRYFAEDVKKEKLYTLRWLLGKDGENFFFGKL